MSLDVLIVGAGPTGLTLGAQLARYGVSFRIIDTGRGVTDLSKALGVQARTLETFDMMGIADQLIERGNPARKFHIYDEGKAIAELSFDYLDSHFPFLLVAPQSETEKVLSGALGGFGAKVEHGASLTSFIHGSRGVVSTVKHDDGVVEHIESRWIVGCDGAHSAVRHGLDLPFVGDEYPEQFLLADVKIDWDLRRDEMYMFLHEGHLLALFPMQNDRCRIVADLPKSDEHTGEPSLEDCQKVINERSPFQTILSDPEWTAYYRIHRRIVPKLQEGNAFLAGDAAHIHSPAAAQGMNTGIQDAFNLAWKIALVSRGVVGESILETYNKERYPVEKAVLKNADSLLKLMSLHQPLATKLRDTLMPLLFSTKLVQEKMRTTISEIAIDYHGSPIIVDRGHGDGPHAGMRTPDVVLDRVNGGSVRLYELLRDGKFVAILFGENDPQVEKIYSKAIGNLSPVINTFFVGESVNGTSGINALKGKFGTPHSRLGVKGDGAVIVRPDGYIGFRSDAYFLSEALPFWTKAMLG